MTRYSWNARNESRHRHTSSPAVLLRAAAKEHISWTSLQWGLGGGPLRFLEETCSSARLLMLSRYFGQGTANSPGPHVDVDPRVWFVSSDCSRTSRWGVMYGLTVPRCDGRELGPSHQAVCLQFGDNPTKDVEATRVRSHADTSGRGLDSAEHWSADLEWSVSKNFKLFHTL